MDPRVRRLAKVAGRVAISGAALYLVFRQIEVQEVLRVLTTTDVRWLAGAVLAYVGSKIISAIRLNYYFQANHIILTWGDNLRLYFIGMFYNLFLPGGIGGDGYKIWWLHKEERGGAAKAFQSVLGDRISGLFLLALLACALGWAAFPNLPWRSLMLAAAVLLLPALYMLQRLFAPHFNPSFLPATLLAGATQLLQVTCAWMLLMGLGVSAQPEVYLTVFLMSSLVSILPISIGGVGIRELVFIWAAELAPIDKGVSVAFALLFFLVSAISSLPGAVIATPVSTKSVP